MASRRELTRAIARGPSGPKIGAFFDVDRTLLSGFSIAAFLRDNASNADLLWSPETADQTSLWEPQSG